MMLGHTAMCCFNQDNPHFIVVYTSSEEMKMLQLYIYYQCDFRNRYVKCKNIKHGYHGHL